MKIKTLGKRIQIKIDEPSAGGLDISSLNVAKETGEVIGLGADVTLPVKIGDRILFKAWAVDIISEGTSKYYFISQDTDGICAIVQSEPIKTRNVEKIIKK